MDCLGISVDFLREFKSKYLCGKETASVTEVCTDILIPATTELSCAFSDLYRGRRSPSSHQPYIDKATVFVIHTWKSCLLDTINLMIKYSEEQRWRSPPYFWFDLFINNQHRTSQFPEDWWYNGFRNIIRGIGHTLLILDSLHKPLPLKRSWCLWEILCSHLEETKLEIRFTSETTASFNEALLKEFNNILTSFGDIDMFNATAAKQEDKKMIDRVIQTSMTFEGMNRKIKKTLYHWVLKKATMLESRLGSRSKSSSSIFPKSPSCSQEPVRDVRLASLQNNLAKLVYDLNQDAQSALSFIEKELEINKNNIGQESLQVASTLLELALFYQREGKYDAAVTACQQTIDITSAKNYTEGVMNGLIRLGSIYLNQSKIRKAKSTHFKAMEMVEEIIEKNGESELRLKKAEIFNFLAADFMEEALFEEALERYKSAHEIYCQELGQQHTDTLESMENQVKVLCVQGRLDGALQLAKEILKVRLECLDKDHPHVGSSWNTLGVLKTKLKDFESAELDLKEALRIRKSNFGEKNSDTIQTLLDLTELMICQGRYYAAAKKCEEAMQFGEQCLAPSQIATSYSVYGKVLRHLGAHLDAAEFIRKALRISKEELNEGDFSLRAAQYLLELGMLHATSTIIYKPEEADDEFNKARDMRSAILGPDNILVTQISDQIASLKMEEAAGGKKKAKAGKNK